MELVTVQVHSKHQVKPAEDVAVVTGSLVAAIDGVTDKAGLGYTWHGEEVTSGRFAALVVADVLSRVEADEDPRVILDTATQALANEVNQQYPGLEQRLFPGCVLVVFQPAINTIWRVGDTQFSLDGHVTTHTSLMDRATCQMRSAVTHTYLAAGVSAEVLAIEDPGRAAIHDLLCRQQLMANKPGPYGYGVLNGAAVPDAFVDIFHDATTPGQTLVLATDGYPELLATYEETELRLADLLRLDPLCINENPGTKALLPDAVSFDDRTWLEVLT